MKKNESEQTPEQTLVALKCPIAECPSREARVLKDSHNGVPTSVRQYQCVRCSHSWVVAVGGDIGI